MAIIGFSHRLTWKDFPKVDERPDGDEDASTIPSIGLKWEATPVDVSGKWKIKECTVTLSLNKAKSWVVRGRETDELLKHEQRHWDIAAIAARELDQRLTNLSGSGSAQDAVDSLRAEIEANLANVHLRYDEDAECGTEHGVRKNLQARWDLHIAKAKGDRTATVQQLDICPPEEKAPDRPKKKAAGNK